MTASVVQVDGVDLVATVETARVDIGDATWATLVPKRVLHLENSLLHFVVGLAEAVALLHLRTLVITLETLQYRGTTALCLVK
jgi:hypothetical protein